MTLSSAQNAFHLEGQTALITGGGTGLGFGIAQCFVAAGAKVVLVGRRHAELERACTELGPAAHPLPGDVSDLKTLPRLIDVAEQAVGPLAVLVNNAGIHLKKAAVETTDAEFAAVMQTHVAGAFALTREAGRRMVARKSGCILFTASMSSLMGIPLTVAYATAKTAYLGLVRTLAVEWGINGVRVNAIAPGWIQSEMLEKALNGDPERRARIVSRIPTHQFGHPSDVGWAAVYLASPAARYVNGVILPVDGGAAQSF